MQSVHTNQSNNMTKNQLCEDMTLCDTSDTEEDLEYKINNEIKKVDAVSFEDKKDEIIDIIDKDADIDKEVALEVKDSNQTVNEFELNYNCFECNYRAKVQN